jgi:hypothetical protein
MFENKNSIIKSHTYNDLLKENIFDNKKLLNIIIDLDHTIIYAKIFNKQEILKIKAMEILYSDYYLGKFYIDDKTYLIFTRPYFNYFINTVSMYYNVFIYTNSYKHYCMNIIELIKKKYQNFNPVKIIYRETNTTLIKSLGTICENSDDLHFLNNINGYENFIKKTVIIDDSIEVWKYDKKNIINIKKFIIGKENYSYEKKCIKNMNDENLNGENINEENINMIKINESENYIFDGYNFLFSNKNCITDDILLILSNRLFLIFNLYIENYKIDEDYNIQILISKYKL